MFEILSYDEALKYIHGIERLGSIFGLKSIGELLKRMGNPQDKLKSVHIAGTNGKGSTSCFVSNILTKAGYKTGLYTSPFIEVFNERIRVDGNNIKDDDLGEAISFVKSKIDEMVSEGYSHPTEFDTITAVSFYYFEKVGVDIVVLETGLGGRIDSTNIISDSLVSAITSISLDHTAVLGNSIEEIALVKAGIIKNGGKVVVYNQEKKILDVIKKEADKKGARLWTTNSDSIKMKKEAMSYQIFDLKNIYNIDYNDIKIRMLGNYQVKNALLALDIVSILKNECGYTKIDEESIYSGFIESKWVGRFDILRENPLVIVDGAHNLDASNKLKVQIENCFERIKKEKYKILILGVLADKDVDGIIKNLVPSFDKVILTKPVSPRAMDLKELAIRVGVYCDDIICIEDVGSAIEYAVDLKIEKKIQKIILGAGSLYMIGDIIRKFK